MNVFFLFAFIASLFIWWNADFRSQNFTNAPFNLEEPLQRPVSAHYIQHGRWNLKTLATFQGC